MPPLRFVATIEPVSTCPVNCETCPVSRRDIEQPKARLMSLGVAGAAAARLKHEFGVNYAAFGNWGEPLLHPQIVELLTIFRQVGVGTLYLTSSLSARFDAEALVTSPLNYLDISLSGVTAEIYNMAHRHGDWERIQENIAAIVQARSRHPGALKVGLRWHRYKHNEHQFEAAREFARQHDFEFKPYFAHMGGVDALHDYEHGALPESKRRFIDQNVFLEFVERTIAAHVGGSTCSQSKNLIVHSDGRLLHCCALMSSHESGIDFLALPAKVLQAFKDAPNPSCGECLAKGWAGFMHANKDDARSPQEIAAEFGVAAAR